MTTRIRNRGEEKQSSTSKTGHSSAKKQDRTASWSARVHEQSGPDSKDHPVLQLQRSHGNQAVQRLVRSRAIQAKLEVNDPGDRYEQEADRVAKEAVGPFQRRDLVSDVSRPGEQYRGASPVEPRVAETFTTNPAEISAGGAELIRGSRGGRPLPESLRSTFDARFGTDFSDVRVHSDTDSGVLSTELNAAAFTFGHDIYFGPGQYRPDTDAGRRLLVHELTHVVQQGGTREVVQRQPLPGPTPAPAPSPATDLAETRREFVQSMVRFFQGSATFYASPNISMNRQLFDTLVNKWYGMVVRGERMIDDALGGDAALKRELRTAYTAAIRTLMPRAADALGKSQSDLYRENTGRIPMWAWRIPHRSEPGISTPIPEGEDVDLQTGNVSLSINGFDVVIAPDETDQGLNNGGETRIDLRWQTPGFRFERTGRQTVVTSFTPPPQPTVRIQTFYAPGVTASSQSAYGRGTTPEDVAGGQVDPRSTTLGFHEGSHGLDYLEFIRNNPAPQFSGAVGMTRNQFRDAVNSWVSALRQYNADLESFSIQHTDCVGTTIDQHNQGAAVICQHP